MRNGVVAAYGAGTKPVANLCKPAKLAGVLKASKFSVWSARLPEVSDSEPCATDKARNCMARGQLSEMKLIEESRINSLDFYLELSK